MRVFIHSGWSAPAEEIGTVKQGVDALLQVFCAVFFTESTKIGGLVTARIVAFRDGTRHCRARSAGLSRERVPESVTLGAGRRVSLCS